MNNSKNIDTNIMSDDAMLNILLYFDDEFKSGYIENRMSVNDILDVLKEKKYNHELDEDHERYYDKLQAYADTHPDFKELIIDNINTEDSATKATFELHNNDVNKIYFVFRGTAAGEWHDDGMQLSGDVEYSVQQKKALDYFNSVMKNNWDDWKKSRPDVYVTGHSNGGNKAQFVSMMGKEEYVDLIKNTYSMDGQGFSPETLEAMKRDLGEDVYNSRISKIYSIAAANDPVNVLGCRLMPEDHIYYLDFEPEIANSKAGFGNHMPDCYIDKMGQTKSFTEQGEFSKYFQCLSEEIMLMPQHDRSVITRGFMSAIEAGMSIAWKEAPVDMLSFLNSLVADFLPALSHLPEILTIGLIMDLIKHMIEDQERQKQLEESENSLNIESLSIDLQENAVIAFDYVSNKINNLDEKQLSDPIILLEFVTSASGNIEQYTSNIGSTYYQLNNQVHLKINTDFLREYGESLRNINKRVDDIDLNLQELYNRVGLVDLAAMLDRDMLAEHAGKLNNYAEFLDSTASEFERAEQNIQNYA